MDGHWYGCGEAITYTKKMGGPTRYPFTAQKKWGKGLN